MSLLDDLYAQSEAELIDRARREESGVEAVQPAERGGAIVPASQTTQEIRAVAERLDEMARERQAWDNREAQQRTAQHGRAELDQAGWNSHADVGVWWLGYHQDGAFRVAGGGFPKSQLVQHFLPLLHSLGLTPYISRDQLGRWVPVWPGAY